MSYLIVILSVLGVLSVSAACFLMGIFYVSARSEEPPKREPTGIDRKAEMQARIKQYELRNFWSYDGDEQQDPAVRAASDRQP